MRLWRSIQFHKRNGKLHDINKVIPGCKSDDCTVLCPACPIEGVNFERSELEQTDASKRYVEPRRFY